MRNIDRQLQHSHISYIEQKIYVGKQYKPRDDKL